MEGVLDLVTGLSATSDSETPFETDPNIRRLVLPVPEPRSSTHNQKTRCLPGAPTAYEKGEYIVDDTWTFLDEYDRSKSYEIVRGVFENIDNYFRKDKAGKHVRSFLSIAIPKDGAASDATKREVLGVVNIHTDTPRLFPDDWVFHSYQDLIGPLVDQIAILISKRP
jgi:hypothetical protein